MAQNDLHEYMLDRVWPYTLEITIKLLLPDGGFFEDLIAGEIVDEIMSKIPEPSLNPTTRQVISVLYDAAERGEPVDIVSHSQGCVIVRNAMETVSLIGKQSWVEQDLTWLTAAIPLNPEHEVKIIDPLGNEHKRPYCPGQGALLGLSHKSRSGA